jgi:dTDP-6-deoxy-L-talose 4-dehydrogenase (NAD+)
MSPGEQLRDFLPVEQLTHLLVQLASTQKNLGTVNVCSGQPIRVRTLVEQWCHAQQSEIQLDLGVYPYSTFEPMAFWGNVNKCMRILTDSHHG